MVQQLTRIHDAMRPSLYVRSKSETKDNPWLSWCVIKGYEEKQDEKRASYHALLRELDRGKACLFPLFVVER